MRRKGRIYERKYEEVRRQEERKIREMGGKEIREVVKGEETDR